MGSDLAGEDVEDRPPAAAVASDARPPSARVPFSTRGRDEDSAVPTRAHLIRRAASLPSMDVLPSRRRSLSSVVPPGAPFMTNEPDDGELDGSWDDIEVNSEEADGDEEVDFWGGESPSGTAFATQEWPGMDIKMWDEDEDENEYDESGTDSESGELDSDDDEDMDRDGCGPASIELIGHR